MKSCKCGKQLDNSAKACPACGKTFAVTSRLAMAVAVFFGFVILMMIVVSFNTESSKPVVSAAELAAKQKSEALFQRSVAGAKQLRSSMRNPDSFKLSEAIVMDDGGVCYHYRAQNGFGGMNIGEAVLAPNDQFKSTDSPGFEKLWNKECSHKTGKDNAQLIKYALDDK